MPKRSNPFIEDFIPQSKVHVNLKRFNNNEERLQKVYDKTLQLLFNGAKKAEQFVCDSGKINTSNSKNDRLKQLFIGRNGSLLHSGAMIPQRRITAKCVCGNSKADSCAYCDVSLCFACKHHCNVCLQHYCGKCFLTGLDEAEVCVSCYK